MDVKQLNINNYSYELPDQKIAKYPLENRDESRLLIYKDGRISENIFKNIADELVSNSLLVFNNTKVIRARLNFKKKTGSKIEIFCLEPYDPVDYNLAFQAKGINFWHCMVGNLKKWKDEALQLGLIVKGEKTYLTAEKIKQESNSIIIKFKWDKEISFANILESAGNVPIPPYLNRKAEEIDKTRYQTIYSKHKGSVAAPTAGLHFTEEVFKSLTENKLGIAELTLHVGAGTFKPVSTETIDEHEMHTEFFSVSKSFINDLIKNHEKIIAVGTTSLRTIESLYYLGLKIQLNRKIDISELKVSQWEPYNFVKEIKVKTSLQNLLEYLNTNKLERLDSSTQVIIIPGYKFKIVNALVTNYHIPKSTLLLLIAAFIGEKWRDVYNYALNNDFRFLSYGDSSILFREVEL